MMDLNCDLGEGESAQRTRALMRLIDSANIACGGHAGSLASMRRCVLLAQEYGVRIGAHPGPCSGSAGGFGRESGATDPQALALGVLQQVAALEKVAMDAGTTLSHIKLHGAWYHASEADPAVARAYLEVVQQHFPGRIVYALAGGQVARRARRVGLAVWEEAFADRQYLANGHLVPRSEADALVFDVARIRAWLKAGQMPTRTTPVPLRAQTLCVHGDSPQALAYLRQIRGLCPRA